MADMRASATTIVDLPVPVGFWRSVGHSHQAFFKESFVDEAAAAAGQDPVEFRAALLQRHPRHLRVLQRAAELAGWGQPLAPAADGAKRARGVALHQTFGIGGGAGGRGLAGARTRRIRVHRVVCAVDCGIAGQPQSASASRWKAASCSACRPRSTSEIDIEKGQVQQSNYHDCRGAAHGRLPGDRNRHHRRARRTPEGVGEPGTPPIAPAVANALFALTGQRLRALPLKLA